MTSIADPQQPKRLGKGSELLYVQRWSASAYVGLPRAYCGGTWGISGGTAGWGGVGELDMSRNCIRCLPPALLQLPLLTRILASRNRITYIHPSLHHLSRLQVGVWGLGVGVWGLGVGVWGFGLNPCARSFWTYPPTPCECCCIKPTPHLQCELAPACIILSVSHVSQFAVPGCHTSLHWHQV